MKKIITLVFLMVFGYSQAQQAFKGKGDKRFNIGLNMQDSGTGIQVSTDFGLGENLSYGFSSTYLLDAKNVEGIKAVFADRFDAKFRLNANIGSVMKLNPKMDVYPGLTLSLKNFGGHLGMRYFFTDGFGLFAEAAAPIAKYNDNDKHFNSLNNQFTMTIGASFSM